MSLSKREHSLLEGVMGLSSLSGISSRGESEESIKAQESFDALDEVLLSEGINDPHILKAVFMAGGGGSGKGWVSKNMFSGTGLKVVNSDDVLEAFASNPSLRAKFKDIAGLRPGGTYDLGKAVDMMSPDIQKAVRPRAKQVAKGLLGLYMQGRLGLVIDSTGRQIEKVNKTKKVLEEAGYDTYMVFVDVPVETALSRNAQRSRKVDPDILVDMHATIRGNLAKFKSLFGSNFAHVDNRDIKKGSQTVKHKGREYHVTNVDAAGEAMRKQGMKLISGPVKNQKGKDWIAAQKHLLTLKNHKESAYRAALGRALTEGDE